jgi:AraC-like DNA-binding protein
MPSLRVIRKPDVRSIMKALPKCFDESGSPQWPFDGWNQRVGAFTGVPTLLRELGADPKRVLARAGLAHDALNDPDKRIPFGALGRLLEFSAQATHHPQFGLLAGRMWRLEDYGAVGKLIRHSPTLREAIRLFVVYHHLMSEGGLAFALKHEGVIDFGFAIYYPRIVGADKIADCMLAGAFNVLRELGGASWAPSQVLVAHAKPTESVLYRNLFKCVPRFDCELSALRFPSYWLDLPVEGADPEQRRLALAQVRAVDPEPLIQQVYRSLCTLLLNGKTSGDDLAQMLSMHRRTLNRRLRDLGTTFQAVLDDVRFEAARQLLCYSEVSLDEIAASLGYAGVSPFMRTFRRWTGITPGQWRHRAATQRVAAEAAILRRAPRSVTNTKPLITPQATWNGRPREREVA